MSLQVWHKLKGLHKNFGKKYPESKLRRIIMTITLIELLKKQNEVAKKIDRFSGSVTIRRAHKVLMQALIRSFEVGFKTNAAWLQHVNPVLSDLKKKFEKLFANSSSASLLDELADGCEVMRCFWEKFYAYHLLQMSEGANKKIVSRKVFKAWFKDLALYVLRTTLNELQRKNIKLVTIGFDASNAVSDLTRVATLLEIAENINEENRAELLLVLGRHFLRGSMHRTEEKSGIYDLINQLITALNQFRQSHAKGLVRLMLASMLFFALPITSRGTRTTRFRLIIDSSYYAFIVMCRLGWHRLASFNRFEINELLQEARLRIVKSNDAERLREADLISQEFMQENLEKLFERDPDGTFRIKNWDQLTDFIKIAFPKTAIKKNAFLMQENKKLLGKKHPLYMPVTHGLSRLGNKMFYLGFDPFVLRRYAAMVSFDLRKEVSPTLWVRLITDFIDFKYFDGSWSVYTVQANLAFLLMCKAQIVHRKLLRCGLKIHKVKDRGVNALIADFSMPSFSEKLDEAKLRSKLCSLFTLQLCMRWNEAKGIPVFAELGFMEYPPEMSQSMQQLATAYSLFLFSLSVAMLLMPARDLKKLLCLPMGKYVEAVLEAKYLSSFLRAMRADYGANIEASPSLAKQCKAVAVLLRKSGFWWKNLGYNRAKRLEADDLFKRVFSGVTNVSVLTIIKNVLTVQRYANFKTEFAKLLKHVDASSRNVFLGTVIRQSAASSSSRVLAAVTRVPRGLSAAASSRRLELSEDEDFDVTEGWGAGLGAGEGMTQQAAIDVVSAALVVENAARENKKRQQPDDNDWDNDSVSGVKRPRLG
jgi:hypothetical protein